MKEIGSDFHINPFHLINLWLKNRYYWTLNRKEDKNKQFFINGRNTLKYIISNLKEYHFLIPNYSCESVDNQFQDKDYYEITDTLEINIISLMHQIKLNENKKLAVLIIDYFGKRDPYIDKIINLCHDGGILIIQDFTHDIFTNFLYGDISYCSYRKMLPTPYGGYLIDFKNILPKQKKFSIHILYTLLFLLKLISMLLKNFGFLKFIWRPLLIFCEKKIDLITHFGFDWLNYYLYKILETDKEDIITRRKNNNTFLKITMNYPSIEHLRENIFAYPLLFKNEEERDKYKQALINHKIYPAVYWPNNHPVSKKILFIATDQRYTPKDYNINRMIS